MTKNSGKHDEPFITGATVQKRAENLYIWDKLGPQKVTELLKKHGDEVVLRHVRRWITEGGWYEKRKKFHAAYSAKKLKEQAEQRAKRDVTREERIRDRFYAITEKLLDKIEKAIDELDDIKGDARQFISNKVKEVSHALKNCQEVQWRTSQISDEKITDPTTQYEGITILTDDDISLDNKGNEDE